MHETRGVIRAARLLVVALVVGVGVSQVILSVGDWHLRDAGAYWEAALRLRGGEPLYPPLSDTEASEVYRYAPWFAWAWIPLTFLPREVAYALWSLVLVGASVASLHPLIRRRAWLAVAFFLPILVGISAIGNVQPLVVAALVLGVERRTGPLWIGMAASLKAFPILFAVTYLGRRQWRRAAATAALAAVLVGPMLLHDVSNYPTGANSAALLMNWPIVYAGAVAIGILAALRLASSRYGWLSSATVVALSLPRFFVYDVTFLMASVPGHMRTSRDDRPILGRDGRA